MKVIDVAIDKLNDHGWIRGSIGGPDQGYCLLGALEAAVDQVYQVQVYEGWSGARAAYRSALDAVERELDKQARLLRVFGHRPSIAEWNDRFAADADDVIHLLKRVNETLGEDDVP